MTNTTFALNNGVEMPALGLGVFQSGPEDTITAVKAALGLGYRLIDTAAAYFNEEQVAEGLRQSGVARSEVFITTKLWISDYGYDKALHGFDRSMRKLGLEQLDLWLLHQPVPTDWENTVSAWKAAERLLSEGRVQAIGVSNMSDKHLDALISRSEVVPAVNQVELHPFFTQKPLRQFHEDLGIITQAWSPIGGIKRYRGDATPSDDPLSHPAITAIAAKYGKTSAQVVLRWHLEIGDAIVPKSINPARIAENAGIFDFSLDADEIVAIEALDTGVRAGPDPETLSLKTYNKVIED